MSSSGPRWARRWSPLLVPAPEAVEELSWLYLEWTRVYRAGRGASTTAAGEWHDRWLPGVLTRLGQRLASCRTEHRDPVRHPPPPTDAGFDTYLAGDLVDQTEPPSMSPAGHTAGPWQRQPPPQQGWTPS